MKIIKLILLLSFSVFCNGIIAQEISANIFSEKDSVSIGDSVIIKWDVKNADKVYVFPFAVSDSIGERKIKIKSNYTFIVIAQDSSEQKIIKKTIWLKTKSRGTRYLDDAEYTHPIRGRLKGRSLIEFSEMLENILQNKMRFSISISNTTSNKNIVVKTNLADRDYLLTDEDKDNRINKRRISYLISFELDNEIKGQINFTIKALIEKKKIIKTTYIKETNEDNYHSEIQKLKTIIESK
ncbi:hypothetical protein IMCC3317_34400 [Kordia antarctica]|uniref:Uncharacterized protein n=1 Tax=Kordia antarctica TaxID=1218801 RepID=A0A7L4ZPD1_9FLAO|nr:hypothetical protein [Kordia antarctica]QHI38056.1 hypothetical protein IMCC3317_34400 [Kordia antarctica]